MGLNIASNENAERQAQALELIAKHLMQTGSVVAWPDVQEITGTAWAAATSRRAASWR